MSAPLTCITWHDLAPATTPATAHLGVTTSPEAFQRQLDHIQKHYNIIDLDRLLSGDLPKRAALLTFDDAYASIARVAAPLLAERRLPAVLFVNPAPVSHGFVPLDVLASIVASRLGLARLAALLSMNNRETASFAAFMDTGVAPMTLDQRAALKHHLLRELDVSEATLHRDLDLFMTARDLAGLPAKGIEVANHTATHVHCGGLSADEARREIVDAGVTIASLTGHEVRAFAFPWGRRQDATAAIMDLLRRSGHRASFLVHGRNNARRPAADIWYRVLLRNETGPRLTAALTHLPRLREWRARLAGPPDPVPAHVTTPQRSLRD